MSKLVFTKHAEETLRALKGSQYVNPVLNLLARLEDDPTLVPFRTATDDFGSPVPMADIREAVSGEWHVIFTVDKSSDPPVFVVISIQKPGHDKLAKFRDVFASVVTEVGSTGDPNIFGEFISEPVFVPEDEKGKKPQGKAEKQPR